MDPDPIRSLIESIARCQFWSEYCKENGLQEDDGQGLDWLQAQDDALEGFIVRARILMKDLAHARS